MRHILQSGQTHCYDSTGQEIRCPGSGQDGEVQTGISWPSVRFEVRGETVHDLLTDLFWSQDANLGAFPCTWPDAFRQITDLNRNRYGGYADWRLPNRNELRSLISYQAKKPALPDDHPFVNVFLGWYWSATTAALHPAYAWSIHLEGARMFYGRKDQDQFFWPVRGAGNSILPATGQQQCYDALGLVIDCPGTGQDGALQKGAIWPRPRFIEHHEGIFDRLTELTWARHADLTGGPVAWQQALDAVQEWKKSGTTAGQLWRLPTINELLSLVDCSAHTPALPAGYPFTGVQSEYWSSTTSFFETSWAWVLYLDKGACGVGHKPGKTFFVWPVRGLP